MSEFHFKICEAVCSSLKNESLKDVTHSFTNLTNSSLNIVNLIDARFLGSWFNESHIQLVNSA